MSRYTLTDDARHDLLAIKRWSVKQFGGAITGEYLRGMQACMQSLAENRHAGRDCSQTLYLEGLRAFPYINHMVYYLFAPEGLTVVGVLHQSRLPERLQHRTR